MKPDVSWLFRIILSLGFVALMSVSDTAHAVDDTCIKKLDSCYDKCRQKTATLRPGCESRCRVAHDTCDKECKTLPWRCSGGKLDNVPPDPLRFPSQSKPPSGGVLDTTPPFRAPRPSGTGTRAPN
jgi:hypothetical protein